MGKIFTQRYFLIGFMICCIIIAQASGHFPAGTIAKGEGTKPNPPVYSKSGSDSISLIIFGRVLVPKTVPVTTSDVKSSGSSKTEDKSKKKDKFNIKSSDKLKTNHSLY